MKQRTKLILIISVSLLIVSNLYSQRREVSPVQLKAISSDLFEIVGGRGANGGVYIGDTGVLVIDSKMNQQSVDQVITEIKKVTDKPIIYLVNTHSDGDHISGNKFFPESVTFIAHENCRKDLFLPKRDGSPSEWNDPELAPFLPSITFREKMDIYLGSKKVELWYFGVGHTTGDVVIYFPAQKTAFVGDQIFISRPQLIHSYKGGNSFEHVKTLSNMLETLAAEKFCSGHADIIDRASIKSHIEQMEKRQEKVKKMIEQGMTLDEIKNEFEENEGGLIEAIFNEIKKNTQ